jgi:hypothetical protein
VIAAVPTPAAPDPEAAYYQSVEEFFVSRRGDPLFLSNADWLLIRRWRKAGLPLRVVLRGIGDALDSHAHSWGRKRKVGSLAYCAAEVEVARDRWQRALAMGEDAAGASPLAALAEALERAEPPAGLRERVEELAARVREWAAAATPLREVEAGLAKAEVALLRGLRAEAGAERLAEIDSAADAELAPYASRMPAPVLEQIRKDSIARRVLALFGLPRLTVFGG